MVPRENVWAAIFFQVSDWHNVFWNKMLRTILFNFEKKKKIAESEEEVTMKKKKKVNGIHFNCLLYFLMISIAQTV